MNSVSALFEASQRIVIKIGSSLLIDSENTVHRAWLTALAEDIARLHAGGKQIVIVSSGAIALGRQTLNWGARRLELEEKQAAAACGQIRLCAEWASAFEFAESSLQPAQILLTLDDSENRRRYLNARHTFETLLAQPNVIPIVNENDTVATDEIRFGDNDRLAARVAQMISADLLVLLSDVRGLYTANPATSQKRANLIHEVSQITPEIEAMAGGVGSGFGSGGMRTKLDAAKIAVGAGCQMLIAYGMESHPLQSLLNGSDCTWFKAKANPSSARKHWILGKLRSHGTYVVDDGAVSALMKGKSLLPAGVGQVKGEFDRGDAVTIETLKGQTIGKGLSEYSSAQATRIIGAQSHEIENILGFKYRDTLVHRDDMVVETSIE
ncbi:MAG TPA: glutamate 5-kinase [Pyrinomonadaceae bacterium]|nr:glutamate 5-kinase [Pyrinomonadaceae bacterium]